MNSFEDEHISTILNDVLIQPQYMRSQESLMHRINTELVYMRINTAPQLPCFHFKMEYCLLFYMLLYISSYLLLMINIDNNLRIMILT